MAHEHPALALEEMSPDVIDRIRRALEDEESPAPWIGRAFHSLALAQGNAARVEELEKALVALIAVLNDEQPNAIVIPSPGGRRRIRAAIAAAVAAQADPG